MKKILVLVLILLVTTSCSVKKNKFKKDIISTLPATVDFVVSVDSIKTFLDNFLINDNYFSLIPKLDYFKPKSELTLLYKIDFDYAVTSKLDDLLYTLDINFKKSRIKVKNMVIKNNNLILKLNHISDIDETKKILFQLDNNLILKSKIENSLIFVFKKEFIDNFRKEILNNTVETIKKRLKMLNLDSYEVKYAKDNSIEIKFKSLAEDLEKAKDIISRIAHLEFKSVDDDSNIMDELSKNHEVPKNIEFIYSNYTTGGEQVSDKYYRTKDIDLKYTVDKKTTLQKELKHLKEFVKTLKVPYSHEISYSLVNSRNIYYYRTYLLKKKTIITNKNIVEAESLIDSYNNSPYVSLKFDKDGKKVFADFTKKNKYRKLAIVLDGIVDSAPIIQDEIKGGHASITMGEGNYKELVKKAKMLALLLKKASLKAPLNLISSDLNRKKEKSINDILGFEISNIKELEKIGIDTNRLIAFSLNEELEKNKLDPILENYYFMIPVNNSGLFFKKVDEIAGKFDFISIQNKNNMKIITFKGDRNLNSYLFKKNDYLIWAMSYSKTLNIDNALESFNSSKKLYDISSYNLVRRKIPAKGIYFFANLEGYLKKNNYPFDNYSFSKRYKGSDYDKEALTSLKEYKFFASSISLDSKDFNFKFFAKFISNSGIIKRLDEIKYQKKFVNGIENKNPFAILSFGLNIEKLSWYAKYFLLGFNQGYGMENSFIDNMSKGLGIDFKKDIISQLDGNFNLAVFDAEEINPMNHNFVMTFTIKDKDLFSKSLIKLKNKFYKIVTSEERDGLVIYKVRTPMMISVYLTIKENSVIFSTSKTFFNKALAVRNIKGNIFDIAKKGNFLNQLNSNDFLYLNFNELSKVFKTFQLKEPAKLIKPLKSTIMGFKHDKDTVLGEITVKMNSNHSFFNFFFKLLKKTLGM